MDLINLSRFKFLIHTISIAILVSGCEKEYKHTLKACNNLYVETFNVNPAGVDGDYLTDSINFRLYVGRWDNEHEYFAYSCKGDSIYIHKVNTSDKNCRELTLQDGTRTVRCDIDTIERRVFSLNQLKEKHRIE